MHTAKAHSESSQTSKMEIFAKIINTFRKNFILDVWMGFKYFSALRPLTSQFWLPNSVFWKIVKKKGDFKRH